MILLSNKTVNDLAKLLLGPCEYITGSDNKDLNRKRKNFLKN